MLGLSLISCWALGCVAASLVFLGIMALVAIYVYNRMTLGVCTCKNRMDGKTVIITGCTSGVGKETAKDIARRGARLIMACRNEKLANEFRDELIKETKNDNIVVRKLDLSSLTSVREFAKVINREERRLDVLIHNAGIAEVFQRTVTEDGLELTMATNHFGPFLLTHLLIDLLKKSKPSRIVVVASGVYFLGWVNLNNVNPIETLLPVGHLYYVSKYANIMFTIELARRLEGTGVTANCLHPGMLNTGIWNKVPQPMKLILKLLLQTLSKSVKEGAQTSIHLAVSDKVEGVNGKYFAECQESNLYFGVTNPVRAKKFWELSEPLVKLQPTDPKI